MDIPSVGRILHFFMDSTLEALQNPFPCMICAVSPDNDRVIVGGFTHEGIPFSCKNVPLIQEGQVIPDEGPFCRWPSKPVKTLVIGG